MDANKRAKGVVGVRGKPNPAALRRTGKPLYLLLPAEERKAAARDAEQRGMSLAKHVRDLLEAYRKRKARAA